MITKRTVLILGAGASTPYRFPVGRALMFQVIERLVKERSDSLVPFLNDQFSDELIETFRLQLHRSGKQSVDAFLEHRREYLNVGKAAIASVLIPCEREDALYSVSNEMRWYEYLWEKTSGGEALVCEPPLLSIITFNYDRSLEHFLFLCFKNSYGLRDADAAALVARIQIEHVHGLLAPLSCLGMGGRNYVPDLTKESIRQAATHIKILHEPYDWNMQLAPAHHLLGQADIVCLLGFGFHDENVARLRLPEAVKALNARGGKVYASTVGMGGAERDDLLAMGIVAGTATQGVLDMFREYAVFK